jgi:hypothetical protein
MSIMQLLIHVLCSQTELVVRPERHPALNIMSLTMEGVQLRH